MQDDGNFVVYTNSYIWWATDTHGKGTAPYTLNMQGDGNLVLYDKYNNAQWSTGTHGKGSGSYRMVMQDDGNLVVYSGSTSIWASDTVMSDSMCVGVCKNQIFSDDGRLEARVQDDGNFVFYEHYKFFSQEKTRVVWASNTAGKGTAPYTLKMQGDGNLVLYDKYNNAQWATNTHEKGSGAYFFKVRWYGLCGVYKNILGTSKGDKFINVWAFSLNKN